MSFAALLTTLLALSPASGESARSCNLQSLQQLCAKIAPTEDVVINLPDGSRFRNPRRRGAELPPLNTAEVSRARSRLEQKMEWVKRKMVAEIRAGRSASEMNADQKMFISRIESLKLKVRSQGCGGESVGHYSALKNEVEVCAEAGMQSEAQLTWLLAHEAGHAIDGCTCQLDRMGRTRTLRPSARNPVERNRRVILNQINESSSFLLDPREIQPDVMKVVLDAERAGAVTRIDRGMDPAQFPLNPILSCMGEKNILERGETSPPRGNDCRQRGSFTETPSDIWGTRIAGLALAEKPPTSDLERIGSLSQESIDWMCSPRTGEKPLLALNDPMLTNRLPSRGRYIDDRFRDEATFLTDPNVQAALGCKPDSKMGTCMAQFPSAMRDWGRSASAPAHAPADEDGTR